MICKYTSETLPIIHSFGKMPIANNFLDKKNFKNEFFYNLEFSFSESMGLFQINNYPEVKKMFHSNYSFFSSLSSNMKKHFEEFYFYLNKNDYFNEKSFVVEIGCNDGVLIENFKNNNIKHLGVEPSSNVADVAKSKGIEIFNDFFNEKTVNKITSSHGKADLIVAANVICHIPNLKELFLSVKYLLKNGGFFIFEEPYLLDMISKVSYDQIYDEHIYIFSLMSIDNICKDVGLSLFECEHQDTHGGSMRYFITNQKNYEKTTNLKDCINIEMAKNLHKIETFYDFALNCEKSKKNLINHLIFLKDNNKSIYGYGATSKSTTILNYCNIGPDLIECICDITPEKQNKYSPGMHIPIFNEEYGKNNPPDCFLLFAWNHYKEIIHKEKEYLNSGGEFITHLPNDVF